MTESPDAQQSTDVSGENNSGESGSSEQSLSNVFGQVAICCFLVLLLFYGFCIAGVVFKEPDICFLLGGGRWIVEHGQIPATDPFSYTTHYHPVQYVIEKWLTEVVFYSFEKTLGLTALLIFDGLVLATAFVVVPYRIAYLCGLRGGSAMRLATLTLLTSMSHLAIRPEIFSFLFTAIWFEIMIRINTATRSNTKIRWDYIAMLAFIMVLWCNMHTLFAVGILISGFYSACAIVEKFLPATRDKPFNWTAPIATVVCTLASLANPYMFGLWTYLPNVFGPFNDTNNEMQPINLRTCINPLFVPFYLLILTGIRDLVRSWKLPLHQGDLFFRGLIPLGIFGGVKTVRSIPMSGLFIAGGRARTMEAIESSPDKSCEQSKFALLTDPFKPAWPLVCLITVSVGVYICTFAVTPQVPQNSAAFQPPFKAIEFIEGHRPKGNLLNDPHFGAVMIYRMHDNPPVFIDPRYNLYGNELLQNYWHMVNDDANANDLLDKYKIDWVFLPPKTKLPVHLAKDSNWQLLYSDKDSVIYARNQSSVETSKEKAK